MEAICIPLIVKFSLFSFSFSFFLFRLKSTIDLRKRFLFLLPISFFLRSVRVSVVRIINRGGELAVVMTWNYMALSLGDSYNPFLHSMVQSVTLTFTRDDMPLFCLIRLRKDNLFRRRKKSLPSFIHSNAGRCYARDPFFSPQERRGISLMWPIIRIRHTFPNNCSQSSSSISSIIHQQYHHPSAASSSHQQQHHHHHHRSHTSKLCSRSRIIVIKCVDLHKHRLHESHDCHNKLIKGIKDITRIIRTCHTLSHRNVFFQIPLLLFFVLFLSDCSV